MQTVRSRLAESIADWYKCNPKHLRTVSEILRRPKGSVSLRVLEHFVTNYTQRHRVVLPDPKKPGELVDVYWSYKEALRCFHKTLFDPFCRSTVGRPAEFPVAGAEGDDGTTKRPSLRQLNFFRWAIPLGILEYVSVHLEEVTADMNAHKEPPPAAVDKVPSFAGVLCSRLRAR